MSEDANRCQSPRCQALLMPPQRYCSKDCREDDGDTFQRLLFGAECGYCERQLTRQPEGDWGCAPCRELMARTIGGASLSEATAAWAKFQIKARQ